MAWTSVVFPVPSSPDKPMTAGAVSWAPSSSPNRLSSLADRRIGLELQKLIAQHRRQLEIQLFRRRLHLLLQHADECFAAAVHLAQRAFHRAGDAIGVQNRLAAEVARRASDGLDQRAIRSQEALLVGIEHRDE